VVRHLHRAPRGQLMLLENAPARAPAAGTNFQDNWDVSY
jgi:hypothetical protein